MRVMGLLLANTQGDNILQLLCDTDDCFFVFNFKLLLLRSRLRHCGRIRHHRTWARVKYPPPGTSGLRIFPPPGDFIRVLSQDQHSAPRTWERAKVNVSYRTATQLLLRNTHTHTAGGTTSSYQLLLLLWEQSKLQLFRTSLPSAESSTPQSHGYRNGIC